MAQDKTPSGSTTDFFHLRFTQIQELVYRIDKGDRISGDDLLSALREHEDGHLPETFLKYLEKPLAGWTEKRPGPIPSPYSDRLGEKILLRMLYQGFKAVIDEPGRDLELVADFAAEHLPDIDDSYSNSEKAAQLTALYFGMDKRQGRGILNKISSKK